MKPTVQIICLLAHSIITKQILHQIKILFHLAIKKWPIIKMNNRTIQLILIIRIIREMSNLKFKPMKSALMI